MAISCFQRAVAIREEIGDRPGSGGPLSAIGEILSMRGDYAAALEYQGRAIAALEAARISPHLPAALASYGECLWMLDRREEDPVATSWTTLG